MSKHGSCCAVVMDSQGGIHYAFDSGLTDRAMFFHNIQKARSLPNGDVVLMVGTVRAGEKLVQDLNYHGFNPMNIPRMEWLMEPHGEWEGEALLLRTTGQVVWIGGPYECIELRTPGYFAIGSGGHYAHGVLWDKLAGRKNVTAKMAHEALKSALEAACALDDYCSGPIFIKTFQS